GAEGPEGGERAGLEDLRRSDRKGEGAGGEVHEVPDDGAGQERAGGQHAGGRKSAGGRGGADAEGGAGADGGAGGGARRERREPVGPHDRGSLRDDDPDARDDVRRAEEGGGVPAGDDFEDEHGAGRHQEPGAERPGHGGGVYGERVAQD